MGVLLIFYKSKTEEAPDAAAPVLDAGALANLLADKPSTTAKPKTLRFSLIRQ